MNITQYGEQELSLNFMNDEYLYTQACKARSFSEVKELADQNFTYSPEQLAELEQDFNDNAF